MAAFYLTLTSVAMQSKLLIKMSHQYTSAHQQFPQSMYGNIVNVRTIWCTEKAITVRFVTHGFQKANTFICEIVTVLIVTSQDMLARLLSVQSDIYPFVSKFKLTTKAINARDKMVAPRREQISVRNTLW